MRRCFHRVPLPVAPVGARWLSYSTPLLSQHKRIMLTGPSGVGKSTIVGELIKLRPFLQVRSHTTRAQRPNEPSTAYHFVNKEEFLATPMVEQMLYQGNHYGLAMSVLKDTSQQGDILHTASCDSFHKYHELGFASIMLQAPSTEELVRRIRARDGHDGRVAIALKEHNDAPALAAHFFVMNDDLSVAVEEVLAIIDGLQ